MVLHLDLHTHREVAHLNLYPVGLLLDRMVLLAAQQETLVHLPQALVECHQECQAHLICQAHLWAWAQAPRPIVLLLTIVDLCHKTVFTLHPSLMDLVLVVDPVCQIPLQIVVLLTLVN